jgi:hypothetical protein
MALVSPAEKIADSLSDRFSGIQPFWPPRSPGSPSLPSQLHRLRRPPADAVATRTPGARVAPLSSTTAHVQYPSHREVITFGPAVVPLLLRELEQRPNH